jgi:hypothetical protein
MTFFNDDSISGKEVRRRYDLTRMSRCEEAEAEADKRNLEVIRNDKRLARILLAYRCMNDKDKEAFACLADAKLAHIRDALDRKMTDVPETTKEIV